MKCISWYFSGANLAPCLMVHTVHVRCAYSSLVQLFLAERPHVTKLLLLINLNAKVLLFTCSNTSRSFKIKKRNRINNKGDPCKMPIALIIG